MTTVTQRRAERVRDLVAEQFSAWIDDSMDENSVPASVPILDMDWNGTPTILWEAGPYDWTMYFPHGGIEEEFGFAIKSVASKMPKTVFAEPYSGYALCLYPN